jgi:hypothetical protein
MQTVWFTIALQSCCAVFLSVVAASNVSTETWHPLPLVLFVVLTGSIAHGVLTTCEPCLHSRLSQYFFLLQKAARIFIVFEQILSALTVIPCRGVFVFRGFDGCAFKIALVRALELLPYTVVV